MAKKVVVGMSGGVDSSVAAYLLNKQGYDVIGATMQIWQDKEPEMLEHEGGCCGLSAVDDARRVAFKLGIPYYVMNFKEDFKKYVIDYFIEAYVKGETPNPCIACNRYVKWESLLNRSLEIGADYIATGHYARIIKLPNGRYTIQKSLADSKDQTYALYNLTQYQLAHTVMPVGEYSKEEIRQLAVEAGLMVANKPDSQDICFVPDSDYAGFIERVTGDKCPEGNFILEDGTVVGKHKGIINYTIGQRKGLGITFGKPMYVKNINAVTNEIVLCSNEELYSQEVLVGNVNCMAVERLEGTVRCVGKIRYSHKGAECTIKPLENGKVKCMFDQPQRAVTKGQAAVFYVDDYIYCGGVIE